MEFTPVTEEDMSYLETNLGHQREDTQNMLKLPIVVDDPDIEGVYYCPVNQDIIFPTSIQQSETASYYFEINIKELDDINEARKRYQLKQRLIGENP